MATVLSANLRNTLYNTLETNSVDLILADGVSNLGDVVSLTSTNLSIVDGSLTMTNSVTFQITEDDFGLEPPSGEVTINKLIWEFSGTTENLIIDITPVTFENPGEYTLNTLTLTIGT